MKNTKKTKRTFKIFAAWDYEFEEQEYNRMSEQGWQLVNGGCFSQKYVFDDSVIYRYQLDYNNHITDMARYDETFRDAGWERVNSTANGWHVFRKAYDRNLPDEAYEIYTDEQSRTEMLTRWRNLCYIIFGVLLLNVGNSLRILSTSDASYIGVGMLITCGLMFGMLIAGIININRMINGQKNTRPYPMKLFVGLLFPMLAVLLISAVFVLIEEGSYGALGMMVGILVVLFIVMIAVFHSRKTKAQ
ncbi:MAG: DUF2812 domain-containing protein [Clostridia bacterium]|nr:DUF2812 domain-containing protein [Clostridia bacterium]